MQRIFFSLLAVFMLIFTAPLYSHCLEKDLPSETELEDEIRWLQAEAVVRTASKQEESLRKAPSVITVYTAEDIKRRGFRNVNEILERTVGFFPTRNVANPVIGTRGVVAGENEPFLLLIDGHNMNSVVDKGPGDYFIFPLITQVKRVEIVRGPGSTLWGSDAALGIIHIITKDGKDINGFQTTLDYASEDGYRYANVLYGNSEDADHDMMFSFTSAEADGFPKNGFFPSEGFFELGSMDEIKDSWELYGKVRQKQFTFTARAADLLDSRLDSTMNWLDLNHSKPAEYNRRKHYFLDLGHVKSFNKKTSLETRIFSNFIERWQGQANRVVTPELDAVHEGYYSREMNLGLEMMLRAKILKKHQLVSGIQVVQTEIDPVYQTLQYSSSGNNTGGGPEITPLVTPEDKDLNLAAYIEDNWSVFDNLNLILGLRIDHNDLREDNTRVLPRFATILGISRHWTAKYLYNTGYVRPPVAKSFLNQKPLINTTYINADGDLVSAPTPQFGVEESEEVESHDIQVIYSTGNLQTSITGYYTVFDNAFNFSGRDGQIDGVDHILFYVNSNKITSSGFELDLQHKINSSISWYGNYSHVLRSKIDRLEGFANGIAYSFEGTYMVDDERTLTQFPHQMWNLGTDLMLSRTIFLNFHYRGWNRIRGQIPNNSTAYEMQRPEHFFDMNLLFTDILVKTLEVSLYAKNILDNDDSRYILPLAGHWSARGRSAGMRVSYTF
ncbi:MAG: TonB-dependent receptor [Desulfobacterales bacterium]